MDTRDETAAEQAARWNGAAGQAWVAAQAVLEEMFRPFEGLLSEAIPSGSSGHVLDIGCGTGSTTIAVARRLAPQGRSTGLDISQPMIAAARARAAREQVAATFICADAQTYPFEPASVDAIVSRFGVMFFSDPVAAFSNLRRAVRDDGRLQVITWRGVAENPFMTTAERAAARLLPRLPMRRPDEPGQFAFADPSRVQTILQDSGWGPIETDRLDVECVFPASSLTQYVTRLGPVGLALQEVDEPTRTQVVDVATAAFAPYVHGPDVRFTAACWMVRARPAAR